MGALRGWDEEELEIRSCISRSLCSTDKISVVSFRATSVNTCVSGRHSRNVARHWFFAIRFAPRPGRALKFLHMIDVTYIYHVSTSGGPTRSRSETYGKTLSSEKP